MRRGTVIILVAIILIIVLVAVVALPRLSNILRPAAPTATVYQVFYAQQKIAQGTIVTEELLGTYTLPETSVADVMFKIDEKSSLLGQKAKQDIEQGSIITSGDVVPPDVGLDAGGPAWANIIAAGKNAITIPISRLSAVGYGIADGAHVNVIACMLVVDVDPSYQSVTPNYVSALTGPANIEPSKMPGITVGINNSAVAPQVFPYQGRTEVESAFQQGIYIVPSEPQRPRPVCQMIIQDVSVLKLGNFPLTAEQVAANQAAPTPQPGAQQTSSGQTPDIVTLVVSPQEAVVLTYLVYTNTPLYLTLRNSGDTARQVTESATLQFLLSQHSITVPVKLAYSLTPRVDTLSLPFLPNDIVTVTPE
ncbi:MAG: SAF domain-containing protein [Chloroflexota bacterium]